MLELVYDKDVDVAGDWHTLEVYLTEGGEEALAVFLPRAERPERSCAEVWDLAREVSRSLAPLARLRVLMCAASERRYRWLVNDPPPPHWRDAPIEEVRGSGLAWA